MAAAGVTASCVYFTIRFGRFLRYRDQHLDSRADIGSWNKFDLLWAKTDKTQKSEDARFAELIAALPLATDPLPAKPPRKNARMAPPAPGADWPLATEAEAIIAAKATSPEPTPEPAPAPEMTKAEFESVCTPAPELDPGAAKREAKTAAQRIRRALAKGRIQWRGNSELTAAAAE